MAFGKLILIVSEALPWLGFVICQHRTENRKSMGVRTESTGL